MDKYYQIIKQKYQDKGDDFTELFQAVISVGDKIGLDKALEYLEKCVTEKWASWLDGNLNKTGNPIEDAYKIFYEGYLEISAPKDGEIIEKTDKKLVTRWRNHCPILEACEKLGLDTREVCKKAYHKPVQVFLSKIDPRLKFDRNYNRIRPHASYCEEIIILEKIEK